MSLYKKLFQQTFIYGIAAVFPKIIGFLMVRFYVDWMPENAYGSYSLIFSWIMFLNVVLSFGMETTFFRFYNKYDDKKQVIANSLKIVLGISILFLVFVMSFISSISEYFAIDKTVVLFLIFILVIDALCVVPFAMIRADSRSKKYTVIKMINVLLFSALTIVFLYLIPNFLPNSNLFIVNFEVGYAYLANLIASFICLLMVLNSYKFLKYKFDTFLGKKMLAYSFPIMVGGLAFVVNEAFDKVFLNDILPTDIAKLEVARYSAIYKLGLFMVLFRMAYTLGIEPFFFNYAKENDAKEKYATVTKYFILFGSIMMLSIIVFADFLKILMVPKSSYWSAMEIVPYVILANFMLGIYTNLSVWYKIQDKTYIGMYISILGALLTIGFNYILIPYLGILGSAITTLIAYGIMLVISYILGQKSYPISYDKKSISIYLGLSTIFSFVHFYQFRENYIVGILFILILITIIILNEKPLITKMLASKKV